MSNDDTTLDDDQNPNDANLAHLREQASQTKAAQAEAAAAKRELLFARAGIDTDTKIGGLLFKTWEGDDLTALKAEAVELGIGTPAPAPDPAVTDASQQQFRQGFTGQPAGAVDTPTPDPYLTALTEFHKAVDAGQDDEAARMDAFGRIFKAATDGDRRVFFDETAFRTQNVNTGGVV